MSAKVSDGGALVGKAKCDSDDNIYIRLAHSDDHVGTKLPIEKIKPDGNVVASFKVTDARTDVHAMDFFVTARGDVYEGAWDRDGRMHVLEFSSNASLTSDVTLDVDPPVFPYQIAVFRSGEMLLSGLHGRHLYTPFTAVFDSRGKLIKKIYEPEDEDSRNRIESGDNTLITDAGTGNNFVYEGDVALGSDGNVYLLRSISPALIYVISPTGEVTRKLRIDSPAPGLVAQRVRAAPGRLAISFLEHNSTVGRTKVVDFQGNSVVDYMTDDLKIYPGLPGCYTPHGFIFVDDDGADHVYLRKAEPK